MARIACFIDTDHLRGAIQHEGRNSGHTWRFFTASTLNGRVRAEAAQFVPDLVLLEILPHIDTTHLFVFLRSDQQLGGVPVIFVSTDERAHEQCSMLHADACLQYPFAAETFWRALVRFVPEVRAANR